MNKPNDIVTSVEIMAEFEFFTVKSEAIYRVNAAQTLFSTYYFKNITTCIFIHDFEARTI